MGHRGKSSKADAILSSGEGSFAEGIYTATLPSPLGPLRAGVFQGRLCLLAFEDPGTDTLGEAVRFFHAPAIQAEHPLFITLKNQLGAYFAGRLRDFTVPLLYPGTPFQERVWEGLRSIPYGARWSYADLARFIGARSSSSRAVGQANGRNRIGIIIPCHRVIAADGGIGGYAGGLERKQALLDLEAHQAPGPYRARGSA
jgi:AraC family transcriptional regulator of adaptative response/methylated-DNA-[protein]-cysteine methyltransferase